MQLGRSPIRKLQSTLPLKSRLFVLSSIYGSGINDSTFSCQKEGFQCTVTYVSIHEVILLMLEVWRKRSLATRALPLYPLNHPTSF
jgi:hypothetical protein